MGEAPALASLVTAGMVTSLGHDRAASCAAIRAAFSSYRESRFVDRSGNTVVGGFLDALGPLEGTARLAQLAAGALLPLVERLESLGLDAAEAPLYLGLPAPRPGLDPKGQPLRLLAELVGLRAGPKWTVVNEGHGSALAGLHRAIGEIAGGGAELALVGGVDSYWHEETIEWLHDQGRLVSEDSLDGFTPGEAAAFVLVASPAGARRLRLKPEASVISLSVDREPHPRDGSGICTGQGLTSVLRSALRAKNGQGARPDWVLCDMNGETFRGTEWGYAYLRTGRLVRDPLEIWHPADALGDVGAASGAVLLAEAMHALSQGYARGPRALVWSASDGPLRAAAVLESGGAS